MLYPGTEYSYANEHGQSVEPSRVFHYVYPDNNGQLSSHMILDENASGLNQQQNQYAPNAIQGSQPLAKCSVLYMGTAISSPGERGIDAIQEPLSRRYPVDGKEIVRGIEAWLAIYDNGLQLQFAHDPSVILFYPIRSLIYCASIRFATRTQTGAEFPNGWRFVPLDSPAAARIENTRNPPLFAVTFRRTRHLPVDECHCFVTKTKQAALALVQACFSAYQATIPQQDCSKVPLYYRVDDYGSKNKEIDNEIRIVPAPDRERMLDYQTNAEGPGFFYKTDRVPIDSWQLWEHHKHDNDRLARNRLLTSRSPSYSSSKSKSRSSSSCSLCTSSCSSCRQNYRRHCRHHQRRQLASIGSIFTAQQQQQQQSIPSYDSRSLSAITDATTKPISAEQPAQTMANPYAPAPNLICVECIKDVNSGKDVFIRWLSDTNSALESTVNDQRLASVPQQAYSTKPTINSNTNYDHQMDRELPKEIERLALHDEHLRKSLLFDDRPSSKLSNYQQKKHKERQKRESYHDIDNQQMDYEVVNGFFEDRHGKRRSLKLYRDHIGMVKDYRHLHNDLVNSSGPTNHRRRTHRMTSLTRSLIQEQQQQQFSTSIFPLFNRQSIRPFGTTFLPYNVSLYPKQMFKTTPLFSQPNFPSRVSFAHPSLWYRPMW